MANTFLNRTYTFAIVLFCIALLSFAIFNTAVWGADTDFSDGITVDSTLDTADANVGNGECDDGAGNCTLRAAMQESNATAGTQTINFALTGAPDFTNSAQDGYRIQPASALPIISDTIIINGYSQTGSQTNSAISPAPFNSILLIELDGTNAGGNGIFGDPSNVIALQFVSGSENSTVQGLVINDFTSAGVSVGQGANNVSIYGNYIGTNFTGLVAESNNGQGVTVLGPTTTTGGPSGGTIGGPNPEHRNIISGNDSNSNDPNLVIGVQGISMTSNSPGWEIKGNYIGVGADGTTAVANELGGMTIDYVDDLLVGGPNPGDGNVVSGNGDGGIQPDGCDNIVIQGNSIGTDYTGAAPLPNFGKGLSFLGTTNSIVGGANAGEGNIIANAGNGDPGIFLNSGNGVAGPLDHPQGVSILGNSFYNNSTFGIDLNFDGVTSNDEGDIDTGSNGLLNFPEYLSVEEVGGNTEIFYRLDVPAGDYRIEFFSNSVADASGNGEGETFIGFDNITHTGGGYERYTHTLVGVTGLANLAMTTTERNVASNSTFGSTSEFSSNEVSPSFSDFAIASEIVNPDDA